MKITVVGAGYVGLVTSACLAEINLDVTCVDIDEDKISRLSQGIIPIFEPGLEEIVKRTSSKGKLHFTTSLSDAMKHTDAVFIAVGTPPNEDGSADLKHVTIVAKDIGAFLENYAVVVIKSTVPIGTTKHVQSIIQNELTGRGKNFSFDVASNPEFLKEGTAVADFMSPDRIIIGTESDKAKDILTKIYKPFLLNRFRILFMDIPSSEMTKYASNAMLATRISFINEVATLCEKVGANVNMVRAGVGADNRIGNKFLYPGIGYGGSCFPKDVKALIHLAASHGQTMQLLKSVETINENQKLKLYEKILAHFKGNIQGKTFAMWGLSFKPNTDDMREAPSLVLIDTLTKHGARVQAYDPIAMKEAPKYLGQNHAVILCASSTEALKNANALLLVTEWAEFRTPDFDDIKRLLKEPIIFDGRNLYDKNELTQKGFTHYGIGH